MSAPLAQQVLDQVKLTWAAPPDETVSESAAKYRRVAGSSPFPGQWKNETTPYLVEIMDCDDDPEIHTIVIMKASRVGATEAFICVFSKRVHGDPRNMLYVQTSDGEAIKFAKLLLNPAIDATPTLKALVTEQTRRNKDASTTLLKMFPGGSLSIVGAQSPLAFRMVATPIVFCDDIDGFPDDVGEEGDPVDLAKSRAKNFWDKKVYLASTPTIAGASRIESNFNDSDQRYYRVPCQKCGKMQRLVWAQMKWQKGKPETARYVCNNTACKHKHDEWEKIAMLAQGKWKATKPFNGIAGFHLSRLYSPFVPWVEMVEDWLKAQGNPKRMKVFINHQLAECWNTRDTIEHDHETLYNTRREHYPKNADGFRLIPQGALCLTAGVDVQHDRFAIEILAHGVNEETWSYDYREIPADTSLVKQFHEVLDPIWAQTYAHEAGIKFKIVAACVDSSDGARTTQVYKYAKKMLARHVYAIKGRGGKGIPVGGAGTKQKIGDTDETVSLYIVGTDTAKHDLFAHLSIAKHGPGYQHFPFHYDEHYFEMLTAERAVLKKERGRKVLKFEEKPGHPRNEALDCRVYAMAAYEISGVDLQYCKQCIDEAIAESRAASPAKKKTKQKGIRMLSKGVR